MILENTSLINFDNNKQPKCVKFLFIDFIDFFGQIDTINLIHNDEYHVVFYSKVRCTEFSYFYLDRIFRRNKILTRENLAVTLTILMLKYNIFKYFIFRNKEIIIINIFKIILQEAIFRHILYEIIKHIHLKVFFNIEI